MKKIYIFIVGILISLPLISFGYENWYKDQHQVSFPIGNDSYVAWGNVWIDNDINWDLLVAWWDLTIAGKIKEDLIIAWGNIKIQNQIWDDIRIAGWDIRIDWPVWWDVVAFGWNIIIGKNSTISWDLVIYGWKITIEWQIMWLSRIDCDTITLNWTINKDSQIRFKNINVWPNSSIKWNLSYESINESDALKKIVSWNTNYTKINSKNSNKDRIIWFITKYIIFRILFLIIFGSLFVLLWRKIFKWASKHLATNPWKCLLKWFLIYATIPFAILILFITVIWWPFWIMLSFVYIVLFLFYKLINTVIFSTLVIQKLESNKPLQTWKKILIIICFGIVFWLISGIDIIAAFFAVGALITRQFEIISKWIE